MPLTGRCAPSLSRFLGTMTDKQEQRRLERDIQKIFSEDADHCSICRAPFPHNGKTFMGRIAGRKGAVVGECCAGQLNLVIGEGVYLTKGYDVLEQGTRPGRAPSSQREIDQAVSAIQAYVSGTDQRAGDIMRRAGVTSERGAINMLSSPWKTDDAKWFEANPSRSHRLRVAHVGEIDALPSDYKDEPLPLRHEMQIVVRQVEPGARVRLAFGRNLDTPIPDNEAVLHALFDTISGNRSGDKVISVAEIARLATRYAPPKQTS